MSSSVLRFAINLGNAVLTTTLPDGQPGGITVELARKLAARLAAEPRFVTYPAAGKVVADAGQDRWDIAFLAIDPARAETLSFTAPYITIQSSALVYADSPLHHVHDVDRPGVTINVGQNAAYDLWLTRHLQHATLNRLPSSQLAIDAFLAGTGDMAAGIRQPLEAAARSRTDLRVLEGNFTAISQAVCLAKGDSELFARVSEVVDEWLKDGTLAALVAGQLKAD